MTSPTGEHYELRLGEQRAVVVELGAALREYTVAQRQVVTGFAPDERISGGRGQLLVPWPNRIRDGRYDWDGDVQQLPLTEPSAGNAIHGLLRWVPWRPLAVENARITLTSTVFPQPGYPFSLAVRAEYSLTDVGLRVVVTARNVGSAPAPYGVGQHPYLTVGTEFVDDALLTVPADAWLRVDERGNPVGTEPVEGSDYDFRAARTIGEQRLDTAFTALRRDANGRAAVRLEAATGGRAVDLELGQGVDHLQVYTADKLVQSQRRRSIAVEPMSCAPDAFNSGDGLTVLAPGEEHRFAWTVRG